MAQKNKDYWQKRWAEVADKQYNTSSEEMLRQVKKLYDEAAETMAKEVDDIYFKLLQDDIRRTDIWTYKHYRDLSKQLAVSAARIGHTENTIMNVELEKALREIYNATPIPGTSFSLINDTVVAQLVNTVWSGEHFSSRIWNNKAKMLERLKKGITESIILGKSKDKAVADIMAQCGKSFSDADRLVRTELMATINRGQKQRYKDAGYTKLEILVADDERTCERCNSLSGKIVDIDDDTLPAHSRCRCTYAAVVGW